MSSALHELPLFPLNSVIFPGGALPLRLFEPRYLDMVKDCMRNEHGFGIALIKNGNELGQAAKVYKTGTECRIADWETLPDGLLGITAYGETKIHIETRGKDCSPLPKEVHLILYRIYQEALNNILKHADARNARVYLLCWPEGITLRIQDDGKGFKQQEITSQSLGIKFMRERASEIGATLLIISKPGLGTKVEITWPSSKDS